MESVKCFKFKSKCDISPFVMWSNSYTISQENWWENEISDQWKKLIDWMWNNITVLSYYKKLHGYANWKKIWLTRNYIIRLSIVTSVRSIKISMDLILFQRLKHIHHNFIWESRRLMKDWLNWITLVQKIMLLMH